MTEPKVDDSTLEGNFNWVRAWIEQQREQLRRAGVDAASEGGQIFDQLRELGMRWLGVGDLLGQFPPLGRAREQTEAWRELAAAQNECQKLEQELRAVLTRVQVNAFAMLEERVRDRAQANTPIGTHRELYDLWIECGEQIYSQVAHTEAYSKLQAELGNATMRLRARQQKVIEWGLKQFDLPTRSELNTVHRQVRELREKVAALEAQLAASSERART